MVLNAKKTVLGVKPGIGWVKQLSKRAPIVNDFTNVGLIQLHGIPNVK